MRRLLSLICFMFCLTQTYAQKPSLKFNKNGEFKIVQFTDTHYKYDDQKNSQVGLDCLNEVLDKEKPDMVVFTGDIVVSNESFKGLDIVMDVCIRRKIPFATVFGNHDDEYDHTRQELYDYIASKKYCVNPNRTTAEAPDYVVQIKSSQNTDKNAYLLYCIDSHSYTNIKSIPGYDWIKYDQVKWYREQSESFKALNGGKQLPALAFFHIALPEYKDAVVGFDNRMFGIRGEQICCPGTNSGMFNAFKECDDVKGVFVGHDHDNDFAVAYQRVLLAYGRYSGGNTVYNNLRPNGARVIVLKENESEFKTYIRLLGGEIESSVSFPGSFYNAE